MKQLDAQGIIHLFAVLHVVTTVSCRMLGINDELVLTLLTMVMILLVCLRRNLNMEFSAAIIILVNALSYFVGTQGAKLIGLVFSSEIMIHAVCTFVTTEIFGWGAWWLGKILRKIQRGGTSISWAPRTRFLVATVIAIFLFRLFIVSLDSLNVFSEGNLYEMADLFLSNIPVLIILFCVNLIYVRFNRVFLKRKQDGWRFLYMALFVSMATLLSAGMVGFGLPFSFGLDLGWPQVVLLTLVSFISEVIIYVLLYVVDYVWAARQNIRTEQIKRHKAQFEFLKLKQQVNPHFLFNSLNVLDGLVCEGRDEDASDFIHKLAGMYRYMLQNEDSTKISLREEMVFVNMFVDLMKVRFPSGFSVFVEIPEQVMSMTVVPCSLQMLVENALKHNAVSPSSPLEISIKAEAGEVSVENNLRPKKSGANENSTHLGLNNIRQQYLDLSGKDIIIQNDGEKYSVTLPLMNNL